jgi:hypothetical protein
MSYRVDDEVRLTVRLRNTGGPVQSVRAAYMRVDQTSLPPDTTHEPRMYGIVMEPNEGLPFANELTFTGNVPRGIVGGSYCALLSVMWSVGPGSTRQENIALPERFNIEVEDNLPEALPTPPNIEIL